MSLLMVIWVVLMVLWGLTAVPYPAMEPYQGPARNLLAFLAVTILGAVMFGARI